MGERFDTLFTYLRCIGGSVKHLHIEGQKLAVLISRKKGRIGMTQQARNAVVQALWLSKLHPQDFAIFNDQLFSQVGAETTHKSVRAIVIALDGPVSKRKACNKINDR